MCILVAWFSAGGASPPCAAPAAGRLTRPAPPGLQFQLSCGTCQLGLPTLCSPLNLAANRPLSHRFILNRCPAAEVSPVNMVLVRLLLLALLPLLANCQPIPPQCNPAKFAQPTIVTFLGPARSVKVGAPPPPAPPPDCRHRTAATLPPLLRARGCWQIHAGHIPSLGSCHRREHPTSRRPQNVCCRLLLTG